MANKQNFTPEEWTKISESVMLAGMAVSAAEPSGLWGTLKEAFASSSAVAAAKADAGSNDLIRAVIANLETSEGRSAIQEALRTQFTGAKPADVVQRSLANLREVSGILNTKAPGDAPAFKDREPANAHAGVDSVLVVPPDIIHTSEGSGDGAHLLIDIFAPPRRDFIARDWMHNAADYRDPQKDVGSA